MIARHWRGWTTLENVDRYEQFLREKLFPRMFDLAGYRGGYVLRRNVADEVEFIVINQFESIEAIKAFAGPDYTAAVFEPEAKALLSRIEEVAVHYEVCITPSQRVPV